jgi:hypothetical protein
MVSSAVISCRGFWVSGSRNWCRKSVDLAGLRSDDEMLRACVGSMSDWAFCTRFERLNIAHDSAALLAVWVVVQSRRGDSRAPEAFDIIPPRSFSLTPLPVSALPLITQPLIGFGKAPSCKRDILLCSRRTCVCWTGQVYVLLCHLFAEVLAALESQPLHEERDMLYTVFYFSLLVINRIVDGSGHLQ